MSYQGGWRQPDKPFEPTEESNEKERDFSKVAKRVESNPKNRGLFQPKKKIGRDGGGSRPYRGVDTAGLGFLVRSRANPNSKIDDEG